MRIILKEDVPSLGKIGEIKEVKDGYARNYLLPKGLAVIATEGNIKTEEGCLSVPGIYEPVVRYESITVTALNPMGEPVKMDAEGLLAVCIQHEMDHLDGKLFVDYLSEMKRQRIRKKLAKDRRKNM